MRGKQSLRKGVEKEEGERHIESKVGKIFQ